MRRRNRRGKVGVPRRLDVGGLLRIEAGTVQRRVRIMFFCFLGKTKTPPLKRAMTLAY
jgi:hypothetical protein